MGRVKAFLMDMIENPEDYDHDFDNWFYTNEIKEDSLEEVKDESNLSDL